jgi:hypothetical protein
MEKRTLLLFLLVVPNYCFPLLEDNALDLENDAMPHDEATAKEAGSYHCTKLTYIHTYMSHIL